MSCLLSFRVTAPTVRTSEDALPAFAKSTAAHAIRETMRDPGIEAITDISTKEARVCSYSGSLRPQFVFNPQGAAPCPDAVIVVM